MNINENRMCKGLFFTSLDHKKETSTLLKEGSYTFAEPTNENNQLHIKQLEI